MTWLDEKLQNANYRRLDEIRKEVIKEEKTRLKMKTLNKSQVDSSFINFILPEVKNAYEQDGIKDKPARCEAYNNYVDNLQKSGRLTEQQANDYCIPKHLIK